MSDAHILDIISKWVVMGQSAAQYYSYAVSC